MHEDGYETLLDDDLRYVILERMYEIDRENLGKSGVCISRSELQGELDVEEQELKVNIWYLKQKGLIEESSGDRLEITSQGRTTFE